MKEKKAITSIFLNKWRPDKEGNCSVSIRVTFNRQKRYYPTEFKLSPDHFAKTQGVRPRGEFKNVALKLQAYEKRAADIIDNIPLFTFEAFEKRYYTNIGANSSLSQVFDRRIEEYQEVGRVGSAATYECAKVSLCKFQRNAKFANVTPSFLESYEAWMMDQGNSKTTVGIYLRSLRSLFNDAIADGILSKDIYPFGKRKYEIPTGKNIKKALSIKEVGEIYNYKSKPGSSEEMAKDYWMFLYLCNGMNVKDMALLQYKNIKSDVIEYERSKTARTKRETEPIRVMMNAEVKQIIARHGNIKHSEDSYIFPILKKNLSPLKVKKLVHQKVHVINSHMKAIAHEIGIEKPVTTYVARHSFATIMQRSGASLEYIGEALGHGSMKTTQNYLAGFEDEHKREMAKVLTAFNDNL